MSFYQRHRALKRACLVRELQLLFLHVMGEARDCPLGPGASDPPPLLMNDSILAQVIIYFRLLFRLLAGTTTYTYHFYFLVLARVTVEE